MQIAIPRNSLIEKSLTQIDYADSFSCQFMSNQPIHLESIVRYFLNHNPVWVKYLMKLRNILVKPFGLKTDIEDKPIVHISKGGMVSIFKVLEINDEEILLYVTDKHLEACLSIMLNKIHNIYEVCISTTVHFHNSFGNIYFFFVKPFHKLIIRAVLAQMANQFSQNNKTNPS